MQSRAICPILRLVKVLVVGDDNHVLSRCIDTSKTVLLSVDQMEKMLRLGHWQHSSGEWSLIGLSKKIQHRKGHKKDFTKSFILSWFHPMGPCLPFCYISSVQVVLRKEEAGIYRYRERERERKTGWLFSLKIKLLNLLKNFSTRQYKKCAIPLIQKREMWSNNASNVLRAVISWSDAFWCLSKAFALAC